jgi:putative hydrolase of the HAD superfamily
MPPREPRAVIFDLDDTLYPYEQFRVSGFRAVAAYLAATHGCSERAVLATLLRASDGPDRMREVQACLASFALPASLVDELIAIVRDHAPHLVLSVHTASALNALRRDGWRIGVLTNGDPLVQARKIDALGLWSAVDTVVYATACGSGSGKPDTAPFHAVAHHLDVAPARAVFVGDDEVCDVGGALAAGMHPVLCSAWTRPSRPTRALRIVYHLSDVSAVALSLLEGGSASHAA